MSKTEADLLNLMRADRLVENQRQAKQAVVDAEAAWETVAAVRIEPATHRGSALSGMPSSARAGAREGSCADSELVFGA